MNKNRTQIIEMKVSDLIGADWNYKYKGSEEEIVKLASSIKKDGSSGVLAVREITDQDDNIVFEVIDGNHRLEAVKYLKWEKVPVENFGSIELAEAVTIARRRNHKWFEDDKMQLGSLMSEIVIPFYGETELLTFMPDTASELEAFKNMAAFDWQEPLINEENNSVSSEDKYQKITLIVGEEVFNIWNKWIERTKKTSHLCTDERAFEFAIIEALNVPEEKLGS